MISAPSVKGSGICGTVQVAEPLDACSKLTNKVVPVENNNTKSPFVLIVRGGCSFDEKVRRAQAAGFKAAIVYDNENGDLVASMSSPASAWFSHYLICNASSFVRNMIENIIQKLKLRMECVDQSLGIYEHLSR